MKPKKFKKLKKSIKRKIKRSKLYKVYNILKKNINTFIVYKKCRKKGYSNYMSRCWALRVRNDMAKKNGKKKVEKKWAHDRGFLSYSIDKYGLNDNNYKEIVSDFEYMFIDPINNYYEKWITDRLTPYYILQPFKELLPKIHYNILLREDEIKYISLEDYRVKDKEHFIKTLESEKKLLFIPSQASRAYETFLFEYNEGTYRINGEEYDKAVLIELIENVKRFYIIRSYAESSDEIKSMFYGREPVLKFILSNTENHEVNILHTAVQLERPYRYGLNISKRLNTYKFHEINVDRNKGSFKTTIGEYEYCGCIPNWSDICVKIREISKYMSEVEYFTLFAKVTDDGIKLIDWQRKAWLPKELMPSSPLNVFLKEKSKEKRKKVENKELVYKKPMSRRILQWLQKHYFRKGFREYMLTVWLDMVKDDLFNTKMPLTKKIWAWKRGFPSYRIEQYGLNNDNADKILSDYDYAWVNRINNEYQKWINDKLTMRYYMEALKEYLPEYYYYITKRNNITFIKGLQDLPKRFSNNIDGIIELLIEKEKLVFKPNAGTHGDGFYKLEYADETILANGQPMSKDSLWELISSQKSTYCITEYIDMHEDMKRIYPKTVNSIRVMVLNESCDEPHIAHAYMRIGSSKTGFTDNVGYGGICCYVDRETGRYYGGETIVNHKFYPCNEHPDTGTLIEGYLPHWDKVVEGLKKITQHMPQLEYLGYDIAITENGFKIIEVNIHQDLHKYIKYPDEVKEFFARKCALKKKQNNI